jgi:YihY family inner membrane protein
MEQVDRALRRVDAAQQRHRWSAFTVGVVKKYGDDRGGSLAALITYYGFLSVFPLLLVFVTVLGFVLEGNRGLQHELIDSALADFPIIGAQLRRNVHALSGAGVGFAVGLLVLLWGTLGVAHAAQHAMAQIWNVPGRVRPGFLPRLARALVFLVVLAFGVIGTTVLSGVLAGSDEGTVLTVLGIVLAAALNVGLYLVGMRVLTPKSIPTGDLVPGAVLGGVAWTALQFVGSYLVARQLRHTSELYGFFAVVLGLMFWLYLTAQILVYAAEVNVVRARHLWPRSLAPPPLTPADEETLSAVARAEERRPEQHVDVHFD